MTTAVASTSGITVEEHERVLSAIKLEKEMLEERLRVSELKREKEEMQEKISRLENKLEDENNDKKEKKTSIFSLRRLKLSIQI